MVLNGQDEGGGNVGSCKACGDHGLCIQTQGNVCSNSLLARQPTHHARHTKGVNTELISWDDVISLGLFFERCIE